MTNINEDNVTELEEPTLGVEVELEDDEVILTIRSSNEEAVSARLSPAQVGKLVGVLETWLELTQ